MIRFICQMVITFHAKVSLMNQSCHNNKPVDHCWLIWIDLWASGLVSSDSQGFYLFALWGKKIFPEFNFVFLHLNWLLKTKDRFNVHPETFTWSRPMMAGETEEGWLKFRASPECVFLLWLLLLLLFSPPWQFNFTLLVDNGNYISAEERFRIDLTIFQVIFG